MLYFYWEGGGGMDVLGHNLEKAVALWSHSHIWGTTQCACGYIELSAQCVADILICLSVCRTVT